MSPFELVDFDINRFCCSSPEAAGCSHEITEHSGPGGECRGVFGCTCTRFRKHKANCVHSQTQEVSG